MKKLCMLMLSVVFLFTGCSAKEEPASESQPDVTEEIISDIVQEITGEPVPEYFFETVSHELSDEIDKTSDVIEIREKLFIAQTNDIYINPEDYVGKTIKYEGMMDSYYWADTDMTYYNVIRFGPGCCGIDDNAGFEIEWDGEMPEDNEWVEVVGVLEMYEEMGYTYLRLQVSSLTVLDERGAEYVYM